MTQTHNHKHYKYKLLLFDQTLYLLNTFYKFIHVVENYYI